MVASLFGQLSAAGFYVSSDHLSSSVQDPPVRRSTRRRLMFTTKLFQGEAFYLDLRTSHGARLRPQVEVDLKLLGGRVEAFLSREITHVITDRADLLSQASPSPVAVNPLGSKNGGSSPAVFSRAQALLNKSVSKQQARQNSPSQVSDPISLARKWGIRITTLQKVLNIIEREKSKCDPNRKLAPAKDSGKVRCKKLEGAFIKVEDLSGDYRPSSKTFNRFPVIDLLNPDIAHEQSPFIARKKKTQPANDKEGCAQNVPAMKPDQKTPEDIKAMPKAAWTPKVAPTPKTGAKPKPLAGYCESCDKSYQNLQEHIKSDMHQKFSKNNSNFFTLDSVITKLPTLTGLLSNLNVQQSKQSDLQSSQERGLADTEENISKEIEISQSNENISEDNKQSEIGMKNEPDSEHKLNNDQDETDFYVDTDLKCVKSESQKVKIEDCKKSVPSQSNHLQKSSLGRDGRADDVFTVPCGPVVVTSHCDMTEAYGKSYTGMSQLKSSQLRETSCTANESAVLITSQSDKNSTLPYEEQSHEISLLEDTQGNQRELSFNANTSLVTEMKHSHLSEAEIKHKISSIDDFGDLHRAKAAEINVKEEAKSLEENPELKDTSRRKLRAKRVKIEHESRCNSEPTRNYINNKMNKNLARVKSKLCESPVKSQADMKDLSEGSVQAVLKELNFLNESGAHVDSVQSAISTQPTRDFSHTASSVISENSSSRSSRSSTSQSKRRLVFNKQGSGNSSEAKTDLNGVVQMMQGVEDITNDDLEMMQHVPIPSESNDVTIQEPLSSRGDHFNVSPVKILSQFPFNCFDSRSGASNQSSCTQNSGLLQPPRLKLPGSLSNLSSAGDPMQSESTNASYLDTNDSLQSHQSAHVVNAKTAGASRPSLVESVSMDEADAILPDSVATSQASSYPTSFNNILSNISAGFVPKEAESVQGKDLTQENSTTEQSEPDSDRTIVDEIATNLKPSDNRNTNQNDSQMDISSQSQSSDAVENSIAMNLLEKLQNDEFGSSGDESEQDGLLQGLKAPSDIDLDSFSFTPKKMPVSVLDSILIGVDNSIIPDSQSGNNFNVPPQTVNNFTADSGSYVIPPFYSQGNKSNLLGKEHSVEASHNKTNPILSSAHGKDPSLDNVCLLPEPSPIGNNGQILDKVDRTSAVLNLNEVLMPLDDQNQSRNTVECFEKENAIVVCETAHQVGKTNSEENIDPAGKSMYPVLSEIDVNQILNPIETAVLSCDRFSQGQGCQSAMPENDQNKCESNYATDISRALKSTTDSRGMKTNYVPLIEDVSNSCGTEPDVTENVPVLGISDPNVHQSLKSLDGFSFTQNSTSGNNLQQPFTENSASSGTDFNQNKYSQLSFADLAKSCKVLPTFQNNSNQGQNFELNPKLFSSSNTKENTPVFSPQKQQTKRPWSPSMILNTAKDVQTDNIEKGGIQESNEAFNSSKQVGSKSKAKIPKAKGKKKKSNKEEKEQTEPKPHMDKNSLLLFANSQDFEKTEVPKITKHKKKKTKTPSVTYEEKESTVVEDLNIQCQSPKPNNSLIDMVTPKSKLYLSENNASQNSTVVWKATPSKGLKLKLCRVPVKPLESETTDTSENTSNVDVPKGKGRTKHSKLKKSTKEDKLEKSKKRRRLET